ncbi:MAG TPA: hypothetical protein VJA21_33925 [Verrucomicrobiae bacterium]
MSCTNPALTDHETGWVSEVTGRLRLIQADAAGVTSEQRREFLNEEISRSLKTVTPGRRKDCLEALLARFPVAGQVLKNPAPLPPAPAATPPPETFDRLFERFLKAAAAVPETQKAEVVKRLAEAGLGGPRGGSPALEITDEMRQALGLPAGQGASMANVARLCLLVLDSLYRLDQTALATMRELAPRSQLLKRPQDFRNAVVQYLGRPDAESVEPQVRMVSSLLGALLAAILGGGRDFGRHYVERLSPSAIEDVVTGEGGGSIFGKSKKERCWDKYVLLAREFETPDLVDRRIRDCMAAFVEKKVLGAR